MKIVVAGYYGCGNLGDDALLMGLLKGLNGRHEVTALSGNPDATATAFGIAAVRRKDLKGVTEAIQTSDALVFGGGGLLQDTTSLLSLKYYTHLIETAFRARKRIVLLGQGIGPIGSVLGRRAAARAFRQCDAILTRDEGSMRLVEQLAGDCKARKAVTDDLAWLAIDGGQKAVGSRRIAICARPWKNQTSWIVDSFKGFADQALREGWDAIPVSFDRGMDDDVLNLIRPGTSFASTPAETLEALAGVETTVSMRLHGGIFSAGLGIPPTLVSYDDKVTAFAHSIGAVPLMVGNLSAGSLWEAFVKTQESRLRLEGMVRERAEIGFKRAGINISVLEETLVGRI